MSHAKTEIEQISGNTHWAADYLARRYGLDLSPGALRWRRYAGLGPEYVRVGRRRIQYFRAALDRFARGGDR